MHGNKCHCLVFTTTDEVDHGEFEIYGDPMTRDGDEGREIGAPGAKSVAGDPGEDAQIAIQQRTRRISARPARLEPRVAAI